MIDTVNIIAMIATAIFGMIAWFAPRLTLKKLDLKTNGSNLGMSEIRAANGALFVGMSVAAMVISLPVAFAMVGFAYAGAAVGRLTSIILDGSGQLVSYSFLAVEVVFALFLIIANL